MSSLKNAPRVTSLGAFFVPHIFIIISVISAFPSAFAADCMPKGKGQLVTVAHVYDGDTVRLSDGRRVRLLGINTPELGRNGKPHQSFAEDAKKAVERFFAREGKTYLYSDIEDQDKYGRHLAHMFKERAGGGELSLEKEMLTQGLGYHVAIPPNMALADCYAEAENIARNKRRGLWRSEKSQAQKIADAISSEAVSKGGYQRITAKVSRVTFKKAWWINFSDSFTAVIYPENQHYFDRTTVEAWQDQWLEIEGWVYKSSYKGQPQWRVKLETPYGV
ncbi:MAG: thermonuclease family protein, partial [Porticoccaceae bacterium]|nr:thermonuclease family protein [Porticoccaceae bacterium]